jgi:hypothetical protein
MTIKDQQEEVLNILPAAIRTGYDIDYFILRRHCGYSSDKYGSRKDILHDGYTDLLTEQLAAAAPVEHESV